MRCRSDRLIDIRRRHTRMVRATKRPFLRSMGRRAQRSFLAGGRRIGSLRACIQSRVFVAYRSGDTTRRCRCECECCTRDTTNSFVVPFADNRAVVLRRFMVTRYHMRAAVIDQIPAAGMDVAAHARAITSVRRDLHVCSLLLGVRDNPALGQVAVVAKGDKHGVGSVVGPLPH